MSWRGPLFLVLLLAAAASGWAVWSQRLGRDRAPVGAARSDYTLFDFELVVLDKQGKESFTLRAPRLTRDAGDHAMSLATPRFHIPAAPEARNTGWNVSARSGWVSPQSDELRLRGDVVARSAGDDARPIQLQGEQLNIFPNTHRATAAGEVTVTQPGSILRGQGMTAQLDDKRVRFESNVKVRYVPPGG